MKILVTGASGFVGKHLVESLKRRQDVELLEFDIQNDPFDLDRLVGEADFIFHLAGVNRPEKVEDFQTGNAGLTKEICDKLQSLGRRTPIVITSSIQAALDNPYGVSKKNAENSVLEYSKWAGVRCVVFRLKNVFGKWCRPNYNSVTATFCHNIARDLPISISDPARELDLVYIDDVVSSLVDQVSQGGVELQYREVSRSFKTTLGELANKIRSFRESRKTLLIPDFSDDLTRFLYATYLSYLVGSDFDYSLEKKTDNRGSLAEFIKSPSFGQLFVSRTHPGITRGNHYHHTKVEKFLVAEGEALIRFRLISDNPGTVSQPSVIEHKVTGEDFCVVDIPPGYTHSIENVGKSEMVVLFWSSEIFDALRPDTYMAKVQ